MRSHRLPVGLASTNRLARSNAATTWRVASVVLAAVISYLALTPVPPSVIDTGWDKLNLVLAFSTLAFSAQMAWRPLRRGRLALLIGLLAFGGLLEVLQLGVPGRLAEWTDLIASGVGVGIGAMMAALRLRHSSLHWAVRRDDDE
jgi:VanZ family protein